MNRAASLLLAGVLAGAACGGGDEKGSLDLDGIEAVALERVEPDGAVISVSPRGQALVASSGQTCVVELDGTQGSCVATELMAFEPLDWSPDGARAVVGDRRALNRLEDVDLTVLDVDEGSITVLTDDSTDDVQEGDRDLTPAWVDGDTVTYLRFGGGIEGPLQVATVDLGEEPEAADVEIELELARFLTAGPVFDGSLLVAQRSQQGVEVLSVSADGRRDELLDFEGIGGGVIGASSTERDALVVPEWDAQRFGEPATVNYLRAGEDPVRSEFDATVATVSPDGDLVAAITGPDATGGALTVWDPGDGTTVELVDVEIPIAITWTLDDRLVLWDPDGWQVVELRNG